MSIKLDDVDIDAVHQLCINNGRPMTCARNAIMDDTVLVKCMYDVCRMVLQRSTLKLASSRLVGEGAFAKVCYNAFRNAPLVHMTKTACLCMFSELLLRGVVHVCCVATLPSFVDWATSTQSCQLNALYLLAFMFFKLRHSRHSACCCDSFSDLFSFELHARDQRSVVKCL